MRTIGLKHLITALAALAGFTVIWAAPSQAATWGLDPAVEFVAKTHRHVPLLDTGDMTGAIFSKVVDIDAIETEPPITAAGAHPDATTRFDLLPFSYARDIILDLPAGFLGNPEAVSSCSRDLLEAFQASEPAETCPPSSQVGVISLFLNPGLMSKWETMPVFRIDRPHGAPAAFGFVTWGQTIVLTPRLRSDGDYGLSIDTLDIASIPVMPQRVIATFWGAPAHSRYDTERWNSETADWGASAGLAVRPFLINPPRCNYGEDLATHISMRSWDPPVPGQPDRWLPRDLGPADAPQTPEQYVAYSPKTDDCEFLPPFTADLDMRPTSLTAGSPSGYDVKLEMPYNDDPNGRSMANLKRVEVELPEGVSVSPSAAHGLEGCTDAQAGFGTQSLASCPDASKIGQVSVGTPLLPGPLNGEVFLGSPTADQLLRVFVILKGYGVTVRVAGDVDPDPVTGQLRAVFDDNPQVPFTSMSLKFDSGARASLINPVECGTHEVVTKMTSWNDDVIESRSPFVISADGKGGGCPSSRPFDPWLKGGTVNPVSAEYSPFLLKFGRSDIDQEIDSIAVELPKGLAAKIAGVPRCEAARADTGTCGPESRVGHVQAASGAGPQPFWVPGSGKAATSVSLAGPYRGAPFSLSIVVPAQAGPFDLGRVVVRAPISVDRRTAQVSVDVAESRWYDRFGHLAQTLQGKMPTILEGIPLRLKETRVIMDRENFMVNPTNCGVKQVRATVGAVDGRTADVDSPFRATDCAEMGFNPRFGMKILDKGRRSTLRSWNPRTRFVLRPRSGDANMGPTVVTLPSSVILDQSNIKTLCTRAQYAADNCPEEAIYGYAKAWSPLLDEPVEGPVYMQANGGVRPLPDILADLDGQVRVGLEGWIDTVRRGGRGRLRNRFMVVPDVPVTRFVLTMRGGRNRGLLVNSTDLCRTRERGVARFRGANGKLSVQRPAIQTTFRGCRKVRRLAARRAAKRKAAARAARRSSAASNKSWARYTRRGAISGR